VARVAADATRQRKMNPGAMTTVYPSGLTTADRHRPPFAVVSVHSFLLRGVRRRALACDLRALARRFAADKLAAATVPAPHQRDHSLERHGVLPPTGVLSGAPSSV